MATPEPRDHRHAFARLASAATALMVIDGTVAHVCCEPSARDAAACRSRVVFLADTTAARTDAENHATLHTIYRSFGDLRPAGEALDLIRGG